MKAPVEWKLLSVADLADVRAIYTAESLDRGNSQAVRDHCAIVARLARREHLRRRYPTHELRRLGYSCQRELVPELRDRDLRPDHSTCVRVRGPIADGDAWGELIGDPAARYQRTVDAWDAARLVIEQRERALREQTLECVRSQRP